MIATGTLPAIFDCMGSNQAGPIPLPVQVILNTVDIIKYSVYHIWNCRNREWSWTCLDWGPQ